MKLSITIILLVSGLVSNTFCDGLPEESLLFMTANMRQNALGAIFSYTLDENAFEANPALLGIQSPRYNKLSLLYSFQPYLHLEWSDTKLFCNHFAVCFQNESVGLGGFGFSYTNFTRSFSISESSIDSEGSLYQSNNKVWSADHLNEFMISYGHLLPFSNSCKNAFGISISIDPYIQENFGNPVSNTAVFTNIGYSFSLYNIHLATVLSKIPLHNLPTTLSSIPMSGSIAVAYSDLFTKASNKAISSFIELSYLRNWSVLVNSQYNDPQNEKIISISNDNILFGKLSLRQGMQYAFFENSLKYSFGLGYDFHNLVAIDFYYVPIGDRAIKDCFGFSIAAHSLFRKI